MPAEALPATLDTRPALPQDVGALRKVASEALGQLTEQQRAYVLAFMQHGNATRAAREAGYSERFAPDLARRLKAHAGVQAAVRALAALRGAEASYGPDELRQLLCAALDVSPEAYLVRNESGDLIGVRDMDSLSTAERIRLKRMEARVRKSAKGQRAAIVSCEIELHSPVEVIDRIARLGGMYAGEGVSVNVNALMAQVAPPPLDPMLGEVLDVLCTDAELAEWASGDDETRRRVLRGAVDRARLFLPAQAGEGTS